MTPHGVSCVCRIHEKPCPISTEKAAMKRKPVSAGTSCRRGSWRDTLVETFCRAGSSRFFIACSPRPTSRKSSTGCTTTLHYGDGAVNARPVLYRKTILRPANNAMLFKLSVKNACVEARLVNTDAGNHLALL